MTSDRQSATGPGPKVEGQEFTSGPEDGARARPERRGMTARLSPPGLTGWAQGATLPAMTTVPRIVVRTALLLAIPRLAAADRDIVIETPGERSTSTKAVVGGIFGASLLVGGLGVYWHLDSRSASRDVSASKFTGNAWTSDDIALADQADRSRTRATIAYGIGGALLIGAAIAFIVTDPPSETVLITPTRGTPIIAPTRGGAVLGGMWSF